jgi:hypothetical protein
MIEPKSPFRQFVDFRFGVNASRFFNLPHPIQTLRNLRNPRCPSRNLLLPLNVRVFAGCPDGRLGGNNPLRPTERIVYNIIS